MVDAGVVDVGVGVFAVLVDGLGDCVEVEFEVVVCVAVGEDVVLGVGIGAFGLGTASVFNAVKKGTKLIVPTVKSSL